MKAIKQVMLGELGELFQGLPQRPNDWGQTGQYQMLNIRDLETLELNNQTMETTELSLNAATLKKQLLRPNDVLITTRTRPIRASIVKELHNSVAGQNLAILRPNEQVYPPYVAALLSSTFGQELSEPYFRSSSNIPLISIGTLKSLVIPLPSLETQKTIALLALAFDKETQLRKLEMQQRKILINQSIEHILTR